MSLDFYVKTKCCGISLGNCNITHNLIGMFRVAGLYEVLWHGDGKVAGEVLPLLRAGYEMMSNDPERFRAFDSPNGWGTYGGAMSFLRSVIDLCEEHPQGVIYCSR